MILKRSKFTATVLADGNVLLVGGECVNNNFLFSTQTAELFDPETQTFSSVGLMAEERKLHAATLLNNGQVLITGGTGNGYFPRYAELYTPSTKSFKLTRALQRLERLAHTSTLLKDGKRVLITGGADSEYGNKGIDFAEIYEIDNGIFRTIARMSTARAYHTASLLQDSRVFIFGGSETSMSAEIFDPISEEFQILAPFATGNRLGHTATVLRSGRILIVGGRIQQLRLSSITIFDPLKLTFTNQSAQLSLARDLHSANLLSDGRVVIAGGRSSSQPLTTSTIEIWTEKRHSITLADVALVGSRESHVAVLIPNQKNRMFIAGGVTWKQIKGGWYSAYLDTAEIVSFKHLVVLEDLPLGTISH